MPLAMMFHWAFYFGFSRAMPSLLAATQKWGAFCFFGSICLISLIYVYFAVPVSVLFSSSTVCMDYLLTLAGTGYNRALPRSS